MCVMNDAAMVNSQTLEDVARLEKTLKSDQLPADLNLNDNIMLDTVHEKDKDAVHDGKGQPDGKSGDTQEQRNTDSAPMEQKDHSRLVADMVPCANSRLKRKRIAKQTHTQTREEEKEDLHVNEIGKSNDGVVATLHSPLDHNVSPHAILIQENASLKMGLVKKESDESMGSKEEHGSTVVELAGIPLAPCCKSSRAGVYFVLEKASLVAAYVGKKYQILNPDEHANFLRRKNKNPYDYRPDIVHEALLQIMGSRLCMAGRIHSIFIRTDEGILIRVEPNTQIPKTLGSFCNMMAELLQKFSIKSKGSRGKLLRLIENPVTKHLPVNSRKIGLSFSSPKAVQIKDYVAATSHGENLVFVVGAMAHGKIDADYVDEHISVSTLPLSAGTCLRRICVALEKNLKIH